MAEQFVEQRQEQKTFLGLDQHHRHRRPGRRQLQGGAQPSEATSHHHNGLLFGLGWWHGSDGSGELREP
jgi:hypothetical protein